MCFDCSLSSNFRPNLMTKRNEKTWVEMYLQCDHEYQKSCKTVSDQFFGQPVSKIVDN
jgi:hypothetical protein